MAAWFHWDDQAIHDWSCRRVAIKGWTKAIILDFGRPPRRQDKSGKEAGELTGFDVIHCDEFRKSFWSIADERKRSSERYRQYEEAVSQRRNGLILEGDDLVCRNRGDGELARQGLMSNDTRLSLSLLVHLKSQPDASAFIVGFIEPDISAVFAAIRLHDAVGSRLMTLTDEQLRNYIAISARRSEQLKLMANEARIPFIELTGCDPERAIESAARQILQHADWPVPATSAMRGSVPSATPTGSQPA